MIAQTNVSTFSGNASPGFTNGNISTATFNMPFGMCRDKHENIYVADGGNHCIRKITPEGIVSTYAGTGIAGYKDGAKEEAQFNSPTNLCVDDSGNVYVSDFENHCIRKITSIGKVITIAGSGVAGFLDGAASLAKFDFPRGICMDKKGNAYVGDSWNHRIRKIDPKGNVTTYAGGGNVMGDESVGSYVDAKDTAARFYTPCGLAIDKAGNIFVADAYNHRIRKISTDRMVTTVCGSGPTGKGKGGYADGDFANAIFNTPTEIAISPQGDIYISDTFNHMVRKLDLKGVVSIIAGNGKAGFTNGAGTDAQFDFPRSVVLDETHNKLYVTDFKNNAIRLISLYEKK